MSIIPSLLFMFFHSILPNGELTPQNGHQITLEQNLLNRMLTMGLCNQTSQIPLGWMWWCPCDDIRCRNSHDFTDAEGHKQHNFLIFKCPSKVGVQVHQNMPSLQRLWLLVVTAPPLQAWLLCRWKNSSQCVPGRRKDSTSRNSLLHTVTQDQEQAVSTIQ